MPKKFFPFQVNNRNTRAICEICSKLTIKTTERRHSLLTLKKRRVGKILKAVQETFFMKIVITIIPTKLVSSFVEKENKNQIFSNISFFL